MNKAKFISHRLFVRPFSMKWGYENEIRFYNKSMDLNFNFLVKYIDTGINDKVKRTVLLLPDNPGNSDDYIELCHSLFKNNYRVIIPNYPRTGKVKNISFSYVDSYSSETLHNYFLTLIDDVNIDKIDFIIGHGWSGYDALYLASVMKKSHLILVNFPKIFNSTDAYVGLIPVEFSRLMNQLWSILTMRWIFKTYLYLKQRLIKSVPKFSELSSEEIINTFLCYGGVDFNLAQQNAMINRSQSFGLINLPNYKPIRCKENSKHNCTYCLGIKESDIFSCTLQQNWQSLHPRRRYEINLKQDDELFVNSEAFGRFLVSWMNILSDRVSN